MDTVYDITAGLPAEVIGRVQVGLSLEDADGVRRRGPRLNVASCRLRAPRGFLR